MKVPEAKRVEQRREYHGDVFIDHYEWLREKSNPEVIDYLNAENDYTEHATESLAPLRSQPESGPVSQLRTNCLSKLFWTTPSW